MCQLQASLKGVQYKLAAYKRENEKLSDGAEAARAELTGEGCNVVQVHTKYPRSLLMSAHRLCSWVCLSGCLVQTLRSTNPL